jgi:hypothetical protein
MGNAKCSECRFFRPVTNKVGSCLWHNIPADMDASRCAGQIFRPRG